MIPLARPDINDADIAAVVEVLRTGHLVQGDRVREFEKAIGEYAGSGEIIAVSNCTAALQLSLMALGVGPGDRVGVATFSWPATANAIELCGAQAVFIDIEPTTFGIDPVALARVLKSGQRLSALIPVHVFGNMANMPEIMALADAYEVPVIEDAACALGAVLQGRAAGSWGRLGCFSFHPRKAATTGEGGAVLTSDRELARRLRRLRNHGADPDISPPDFVTAGFNMRLTEFQAALGTSQLSRYGNLLSTRRELARRYDELLSGLPVEYPGELSTGSHIYQSYVVRLREDLVPRRGQLMASLRAQGVEVNIGTHHMPLLSHFRATYGHSPGDFPVTDRVAASALAIPFYSGLLPRDQETVVASLRRETGT